MQKKCKQSCCERAELQSVDSERRSGILCDLENNLFNDDVTSPPMNEMDEILMKEITCDNFAELKVIFEFLLHQLKTMIDQLVNFISGTMEL